MREKLVIMYYLMEVGDFFGGEYAYSYQNDQNAFHLRHTSYLFSHYFNTQSTEVGREKKYLYKMDMKYNKYSSYG